MNIIKSVADNFLSTTTVMTRSVGSFHFDAVTVENHDSTLRVTENPIESGASIADHAVLEPKEVTVTGVMVGYEPHGNVTNSLGSVGGLLKKRVLPVEIKVVTDQALSMANRYFTATESAMNAVPRMIAPFLPDYLGFSSDKSATLDRVGKAYNELLNLQKSGETMMVQTGIKLYENMMLLNIGVIQTVDGSAEFSLTLKEIFIVESQVAAGLAVSRPKTTQMGRTQPKEEDSSVLGEIFK